MELRSKPSDLSGITTYIMKKKVLDHFRPFRKIGNLCEGEYPRRRLLAIAWIQATWLHLKRNLKEKCSPATNYRRHSTMEEYIRRAFGTTGDRLNTATGISASFCRKYCNRCCSRISAAACIMKVNNN